MRMKKMFSYGYAPEPGDEEEDLPETPETEA